LRAATSTAGRGTSARALLAACSATTLRAAGAAALLAFTRAKIVGEILDQPIPFGLFGLANARIILRLFTWAIFKRSARTAFAKLPHKLPLDISKFFVVPAVSRSFGSPITFLLLILFGVLRSLLLLFFLYVLAGAVL
jgi:hypothetical protein